MFSVVLPTYDEAENLPLLLPRIREVLGDSAYEIIIVDDDSPDRTWEIAGKIGRDDPHIRVIRRLGRRGLSSAVIEGFLAAKGSVLAVMDADGQHDMSLLPALRDAAERNRGIALGSRYAEGGGFGDWKKERLKLSQFATWLTHKVCKVKASDPMSGFFAIDRNAFESVVDKLNPKGFKILLDILVRVSADTPVAEIPFTFASRLRGESKLSWRVQLEFLEYLYEVALGRYVPLTFLKYCIVGSIGVLVHLAAYRTASFFFFEEPSGTTIRGFSAAVLVAIEVAIIFNFLLNNVWTFARVRLKGRRALKGFLVFNAACLFGALANFAVSAYLFSAGASEFSSVVFGAVVGVIWNYTINRSMTWKQ